MSNDSQSTFEVTGMSCGHCERAAQNALAELEGVTSVDADHKASRVTISHSSALPDESVLKGIIEEEGYVWGGKVAS